MTKIKKANVDDKLTFLLLIGMSVFLLVTYVLSIFKSYVNADAGYYLGVAELIHQGYVPYRDFQLGYTPLFFYVLQIPRMFMGDYPEYSGYLLFLYLIAFIDAFLMTMLVWKITHNKKLSWFSGLVFLALYYYFEGSYFVLETFSLCLGMVSILLLMKEKVQSGHVFLAGAFSALAFLAKQYGLLFAGVVVVMLLFSDKRWGKKMRDCFVALSGFCVVVASFFLMFWIIGLTPQALIEALRGSGYGIQSIELYVEGVARGVRLFPFLFFIPFLLIDKIISNKALLIGSMTGLILASFQFYFNVLSHYYLYLLPFVLVLNILLWEKIKMQKHSHILLLLYFGFLFASVAIPTQEVYKNSKALVKHDFRKPQIETAKRLRQVVKEYDCQSVLCYWAIQYYGLCPLKPALMEKYGFSFGSDTEETYIERLRDADCFVVKAVDWEKVEKMESVNQCLKNDFSFLGEELTGDVMVFVRNNK